MIVFWFRLGCGLMIVLWFCLGALYILLWSKNDLTFSKSSKFTSCSFLIFLANSIGFPISPNAVLAHISAFLIFSFVTSNAL